MRIRREEKARDGDERQEMEGREKVRDGDGRVKRRQEMEMEKIKCQYKETPQ